MRNTVKSAMVEYVQMNLFDILRTKKAEETKPCLVIGQEVFLLNLDVVRKGNISRAWLCHEREEVPFYGYCVDLEKGLHAVTWDTEIGTRTFTSESEITTRATLVEPTLAKITPQEMDTHDQRSFCYRRSVDSYTLYATVAKVGENRIYRKLFYEYHFLETYPTTKIRDKQYRVFLAKIQKEYIDQGGAELEGPLLLENLYRSTDTLYASWEYSERNGNPYKKSGN